MRYNCDILIIGAGPAGSTAAFEAAKNHAEVLLIDRKKRIGHPVQCAEYIPKLALNEINVSKKCLVHEIKCMLTYFQNGRCVETISPGLIINREIFDLELATKAVKEGVFLKTNTTCISKKGNEIIINESGNDIIIKPKIIIGADGPQSIVGRWINNCNREFIAGIQYTLPLKSEMDYTEIYFRKEFFGGYGWLFPKGDTANVGIGIKINPKHVKYKITRLLNDFVVDLEKKGKINFIPKFKTGGLIPVGGPLNTVKDNILLVGDAAGQTHPITGGGITQAIICGKIAGKIAAKAVNDGKSVLKQYDDQWKAIFGEELKRAKLKRVYLESNWDNLDQIIKKCWTIFREYYEQ